MKNLAAGFVLLVAGCLMLDRSFFPASAQSLVGPLYQESATIADGSSVSGTVDPKARPVVGVSVPAGVEGTVLTFQHSLDGTTWSDVYNLSGEELKITIGSARFVVLAPYELMPGRYLRVRAGTAAMPQSQTGAAVFSLVTRVVQ